MPGSQAGTPRAAVQCGKCGHARIRHTRIAAAGRACAGTVWAPQVLDPNGPVFPGPCGCPGFIEPKE